jgi:hypothetical protein
MYKEGKMGWFEVINTGLHIANTAANISVASSVNKMQQQNERAEQVAIERGEILDLVDRINRRIRKLQLYLSSNPQSSIVLCEFYGNYLKSMGITPSRLSPEDRHILRDLNEKFDDFIEQAKGHLTEGEIKQAYECLDAISDLPGIESALSMKETLVNNSVAADEAEQYLVSTENEWKSISRPATKAQNFRVFGIVLLVLAAFATCFVMPLVIMLPFSGIEMMKTNILNGLITFVFGLVLILLYLASIAGGILLVIKGKIPNAERYQELLKNRNNAIKTVQTRNSAFNIDPKFANYDINELNDLLRQKNERISTVLGNMVEFKKLFLLGE